MSRVADEGGHIVGGSVDQDLACADGHTVICGPIRAVGPALVASGSLRAVSPRLALMIGGVAALLFGLALFVSPESMLAGFGVAAPASTKVLARDVGATLIGLGVINWMARNATGDVLRALLVGNVVVQALELLINAYEIVAGDLPGQSAPGLLIHLVLGAIFIFAMRSTSSRA